MRAPLKSLSSGCRKIEGSSSMSRAALGLGPAITDRRAATSATLLPMGPATAAWAMKPFAGLRPQAEFRRVRLSDDDASGRFYARHKQTVRFSNAILENG